MAVSAVTPVPVARAVPVVMRVSGRMRPVVVTAVPVVAAGLLVWVRPVSPVVTALLVRVTGLMAAPVVRAVTVAMVGPAGPVALRPVAATVALPGRWALPAPAVPVGSAGPAATVSTPQV